MPRRAVVAVVAVGVVAAGLLPEGRAGVGFVLVALAVAAAFVVTAPAEVTRHEIAFGSLTLVLIAMSVVRAADWLIAIDVLVASALACYVAARGTTWRALFAAPFRVLAVSPWVPVAVLRPVVERARRRDNEGYSTLFRTTGVSVVLVVVFGTLFVSADAAFARLANEVLLPDLELANATTRAFTFCLMTVFAGSLVLARPSPSRASADAAWSWSEMAPRAPRKRVEWVVPIAVLDALFAGFVAIQMTVLFGGRDHVEVTPGLTYAEYARQGFFQLLAVAALVLVVVAVAVRVARPDNARDRRIVQALLGGLCALTIVVLASAWYRLNVYEDVYGLSRLRVSVYATIAWLAAMFALVMVAGAAWKASWLPRAAASVTVAGLIAFNLIGPDRLIAERNVARYEAGGDIDLSYLAGLSEDAVPALTKLPAEMRECVLSNLAWKRHTRSDYGWTEFNVSRARARAELERLGVSEEPNYECI